MALLTKDDILSVDDRKTQVVEVPEWGGSVTVANLTGEARDAFEASLTKRRPVLTGPNKGQMENVPDNANVHAKLVARAIVDEGGERMFTDADIAGLGRKSAAALARVFAVAAELSGLGEDAIADAEGNSDTDPSDDSTSSEPTPPESP